MREENFMRKLTLTLTLSRCSFISFSLPWREGVRGRGIERRKFCEETHPHPNPLPGRVRERKEEKSRELPFCHSRNLLSGIQRFLLFNNLDPGLKIAGVTKNGGNPEVFQYRGPLIKPFRGDGKKHPHPNPLPGRVREKNTGVSRQGLPFCHSRNL